MNNSTLFNVPQPTRRLFYVVPESTEIDSLHRLAQLQMGHYPGTNYHRTGHNAVALLLRGAWLLGEENDRRLKWELYRHRV